MQVSAGPYLKCHERGEDAGRHLKPSTSVLGAVVSRGGPNCGLGDVSADWNDHRPGHPPSGDWMQLWWTAVAEHSLHRWGSHRAASVSERFSTTLSRLGKKSSELTTTDIGPGSIPRLDSGRCEARQLARD
jgi:hypothetical protein